MNIIGADIWRWIGTVGLVLVVSYLGIMLLIYAFQSQLLFFPKHEIANIPSDFGLPYDTVTIKTSDNINLAGWFIPHERSKGVILFCHGNAGNISHRIESIQIFHQLALSVLIFDYRGYGNSKGKPSEVGTYRDVEAAWKYLVEEKNIPPKEIIIFGRSLGGAIAAWLAQRVSPKALLIESTFTSIPDLGAEIYPFLPVKKFSKLKYTTKEYVKHLNCPVLIIHSPDDKVAPFHHGKAIFNYARDPKFFLEIRGSHNDGFLTSGDDYIDGIRSFLSGLKKAPSNQKH